MSAVFPFLKFEGQYDVDARFIQIPVKGKGPMRGNASEYGKIRENLAKCQIQKSSTTWMSSRQFQFYLD